MWLGQNKLPEETGRYLNPAASHKEMYNVLKCQTQKILQLCFNIFKTKPFALIQQGNFNVPLYQYAE